MEKNKQAIFYSDNPNRGLNTVKTALGSTEYRINCKKIKGQFYIIDKECFPIGNTYYRIDSGLIEYDHEKKEWFLIKKMPHDMIKGVVGFKNKNHVIGYFTPNYFDNVKVMLNAEKGNNDYHNGHTHTALNKQILIENQYVEDISTGIWYNTKYVNANALQKIGNNINHTHKGYNIEDNATEFEMKKNMYEVYKTNLSKNVQQYAKMLGDTTFGVEFECCKGWIPDNLQYRFGIVTCRDGSLNDETTGLPGPEFVTIPLKGAKGLQTLSDICHELSKRTEIDIKCSLHIHLGNIPRTKLFLTSLYRLSYKIQNELFLMFPYYKVNPEGVKPNGKNYNQKLPSLNIRKIDPDITKKEFNEHLDNAFRSIFSWLSDGVSPSFKWNRKIHQHPQSQKWNRSKRYFWMNAMNTIFSNRNTIEFRPHTPTTNSQKVINWLFICNAIIKFADSNYSRILMTRGGIKLEEVLNYYAKNFGARGELLSAYLNAYVKERTEMFYKDYLKGDKISVHEMAKDKEYVFKWNGITHLF